jgi:hypothetical protein
MALPDERTPPYATARSVGTETNTTDPASWKNSRNSRIG